MYCKGAVVNLAHTNKVGVHALQEQAACQRLLKKPVFLLENLQACCLEIDMVFRNPEK